MHVHVWHVVVGALLVITVAFVGLLLWRGVRPIVLPPPARLLPVTQKDIVQPTSHGSPLTDDARLLALHRRAAAF